LIKDSNKAAGEDENRYKIRNKKDVDYFWKSRQNKDENGNNTLHMVF